MTVQILQGDCRSVLPTLPEKSVHCCVTSPPYFGLRDYGVEGQIGLEQTPNEYVAELVAVFRNVWRVMRDDGTLWLNLGDSYSSGGRKTRDPGRSKIHPSYKGDAFAEGLRPSDPPGVKPKDLLGIPWRVAFALQADGWYLRQDIIWAKPNPMPESVRDRCTKAHEYIFMLSKSQKYFFDAKSIAEQGSANPVTVARNNRFDKGLVGARDGHGSWGQSGSASYDRTPETTRNKRSVWNVATKPYSGAHFATFPPDLIEPCILAGCPAGGTVLDPFGGAGTTGLVSDRLQRNAVLIELNQDYSNIAQARIDDDTGGLFKNEYTL